MAKSDGLETDIWKDPGCKDALASGRSADDIMVLSCPQCGRWGYYHQGSHFYCRFCETGFACLSEGEEPPEHGPYINLEMEGEGHTTLADTLDYEEGP